MFRLRRRFLFLVVILLLGNTRTASSHELHSHDHDHHHDHDHVDHDHHSHDHAHEHRSHEHPTEKNAPPKSHARSPFGEAVFATFVIGLAPVLCVKVIPTRGPYLKGLLAFAAGGLLGDAFIHLLPHALEKVSHSHSDHDHHDHHESHAGHGHQHDTKTQMIFSLFLVGFLAFFVLEKFFVEVGHHHHEHEDDHTHDSATQNEKHDQRLDKNSSQNLRQRKKSKKNALNHLLDNNSTQSHDSGTTASRQRAAVILNFLGDFTHNITDGLAIAGAFSSSFDMGLSTSFAILLHEIPHEIGDYAILIENGVSVQRAMIAQVVTAIGCLLGTCVGFHFKKTSYGTEWILPFTGGGFVYLASGILVGLNSKNHGRAQAFLHIVGVAVGVLLMFGMSAVEDIL